MLEHRRVDQAVRLGHADAADEVADGSGRHAAAAQPRERRHARIVPAIDMAVLHKLREHALGQDRVAEVEPGELVLAGARRDRKMIEQPVVERPMVLEFEGTEGVRDPLDSV
jgi:hypothetical protein